MSRDLDDLSAFLPRLSVSLDTWERSELISSLPAMMMLMRAISSLVGRLRRRSWTPRSSRGATALVVAGRRFFYLPWGRLGGRAIELSADLPPPPWVVPCSSCRDLIAASRALKVMGARGCEPPQIVFIYFSPVSTERPGRTLHAPAGVRRRWRSRPGSPRRHTLPCSVKPFRQAGSAARSRSKAKAFRPSNLTFPVPPAQTSQDRGHLLGLRARPAWQVAHPAGLFRMNRTNWTNFR